MSRQDLERQRNENLKQLDPTVRPHKNSVAFKIKGETPGHILKKTISSYCIRRGVPPDCLINFFNSPANVKRIGSLVTRIESFCKFNGQEFKHEWQRPLTLTEVHMLSGAIYDVWVADNAQRVEIVESCDQSVEAYDEDTVVIRKYVKS